MSHRTEADAQRSVLTAPSGRIPAPTVPADVPSVVPAPGDVRIRGGFTLPGLWGALIFACLSFTPSLVPRTGLVQGVVCGITAAIGYGLGVGAAAIWRAFPDRQPRPTRRWAWRTFQVSGAVLLAVFFALGQFWQHELRLAMEVPAYSIPLVIASPFVAVLLFVLLVLVGRGLRSCYRGLARLLRRWIGPRAANVTGWVVVALVAYLVVSGALLSGAIIAANGVFATRDTTTAAGVQRPTTALRSGGVGSLIPWSSLGWQGRSFTGTGPTAADIGKAVHSPAQEPIRAYAGLASAPDIEGRAALAVAELEHAGGFGRKNLLVVTTTGTGWVDPASADTFEYLTRGDSAIVSMQYSYLPSWLSLLVDGSKAREAGVGLFDAVYERWSQLPVGARPRLYVSGESLGTLGGETAFSGERDLRNRTDGTVFAGPPNSNTLFTAFRNGRDAGSPELQPVYKDGRTVRFTNDAHAGFLPQGQPWNGSRVVYLMHTSDPIVWWSPELILGEPSWIGEPGAEGLAGSRYLPFVTFWQVTADLMVATSVPDGHGHTYRSEYVDAWNAVLQPPGITDDELAALRGKAAATQ
jgi:uncharacterized membrane protein